MERLTEKISNEILVKNKNGNGSRSICYGCDGISNCTTRVCNFYRAMEKLVAYEDTGFEPEDISSNIKTLSSELNNAFEELKVYRNLEEQGLLIKLPCKVGDTVYKLEDYGEWQDVPHVLIPIMCQVELIYLGDDNKVYCDLMSIDLLQDGAMFDEIPINEIYLSKEEAEKVLKERGDYY